MRRITVQILLKFFDTIFVVLWRFLKSTDQKRSNNVNNGQKYQRSCLQMLPLKLSFLGKSNS